MCQPLTQDRYDFKCLFQSSTREKLYQIILCDLGCIYFGVVQFQNRITSRIFEIKKCTGLVVLQNNLTGFNNETPYHSTPHIENSIVHSKITMRVQIVEIEYFFLGDPSST